MNNQERIDYLERNGALEKSEWEALLSSWDEDDRAYAREKAARIAGERFGNQIYIRGLIEFSNYCKNDCYYCGIRKSNQNAARYRLTREEILSCCETGYGLGFRTFVLQGGEDPYYTDDMMEQIIRDVKALFPDCALTLSMGEKDRQTYERWFAAGADRYLLRHETADGSHYAKLHPPELSLEKRKQCLRDLKEIGLQTGCGFMVGSPFQTAENLALDMLFIREFEPHMVGLGPFLPHRDTPFHDRPAGALELTLFLLSLTRIMMPGVLLPATTALGTLHPQGRELGIQAGANVVMPNLSPVGVREKYQLYNNKISTGEEAAEGKRLLERRLNAIGYTLAAGRGDWKE